MKKYLKFHFVSYLNKTVMITASIISVISLFVFVIVGIINKNNIYFEEIYFDSALTFLKIIMVVIACFLAGESFWHDKDQYRVFLLDKKSQRIGYVITKLLVILFLIFSFFILQVLIILIIGLFLKKGYSIKLEEIKTLFKVGMLSMLYGTYSALFTILFTNTFVMIFPIILFLIRELIFSIDNHEIERVISILLPNISLDNGIYTLSYGVIHVILLIISVITLSTILYYSKDLR